MSQSLQSPRGYGPADLRAAYRLPAGAGSGLLVAIVDAFDDPKAESDLGVYRSTYGLPPCTKLNGCFRKVNQYGAQGSYPSKNGYWAAEISLDLDMVSAACPNCRILLVEADDNSFTNLGQSVNEAAALGAVAISNSYGGYEAYAPISVYQDYNHPGAAVVASTGDSGYEYGFDVNFPSSSQYVTAVGGTTLQGSGATRGWTETAWSGSGSGCSRIFPKPSWQLDKGCTKRTVADVGAVADPATGVAVYDTERIPGYDLSGWLVFGGTSVASPIIASVYALAGNAKSVIRGSYAYSHAASLFDVTKGNTGTCRIAYYCTAQLGYDGPTGLGTPNGTGAF